MRRAAARSSAIGFSTSTGLAGGQRAQHLRLVELVRGGDVHRLYLRILDQGFRRLIRAAAEFGHEGGPRRRARIRRRHQTDAGIEQEGRAHQQEGPPQTDHAQAERRAHRSSTSSPFARPTQIIISCRRSSGESTRSR